MSKYRSLLAIGIFSIATNALATTSGDKGNGGDHYAIEFVDLAHQISGWICAGYDNTLGQQVGCKRFADAVDTTTVESTNDELEVGTAVKDALNFPLQEKIMFNRKAWDEMGIGFRRAQLVLHEYLGILQIDDSDYQLSNWISGMDLNAILCVDGKLAISISIGEEGRGVDLSSEYNGDGISGHSDMSSDGFLKLIQRPPYVLNFKNSQNGGPVSVIVSPNEVGMPLKAEITNDGVSSSYQCTLYKETGA